MKKKLLIIEDDEDIQSQLKWSFAKEYKVLQAYNRNEAMNIIKKERPHVVTLDLGLPPEADTAEEGMKCLDEIMRSAPYTKVIIITGNTQKHVAFDAIKKGAYDYFRKPIDIQDLSVIIRRAFHLAEIEAENIKLHRALEKKIGFGGMIGQSYKMQKVFDIIRKVAPTDATVLITGESGTGKELVARAIHENSLRKKGPFIPLNCSAIPETLLESELFGHERGAFTGAISQQKGKFEYAHGGTLFLDEIGELSPNLQAKLLRFLQDRKFTRVGGNKEIEVDTRVLAATNLNLQEAIREGKFRDDLYYRISVISIELPPLRSRGSDIKLIANILLERYSLMFNRKINGFSKRAISAMQNYSWPGNVRELENRIQKAILVAESDLIEPEDLELDYIDQNLDHVELASPYTGLTLKEARRQLEKGLLELTLKKYNGNISKMAEELGITRPTLYDLLEKYKLSFKKKEK